MTSHTRAMRSIWMAGPYTVVAVANFFDGELFDWAAYLGTGDEARVAEDGEKVNPEKAALLFPDLPPEKYRP